MSKECIIPLSKCYSLTPNVIINNKINKVLYNSKTLNYQLNDVISFSLNKWTFDISTNNDGEDIVNSVKENSTFNYEIKSTSSGDLYVDLYIDVEDYLIRNIDRGKCIINMTVYSVFKNSVGVLEKVEDKTYELTYFAFLNPGLYSYIVKTINGRNNLFTQPIIQSSKNGGTIYYNYSFSVKVPQVEENIIQDYVGIESENNDSAYNLDDNSFMNTRNIYNNISISQYNANIIYQNYKNGKITLEATIIVSDYYNENNELVIDKEKGEILSSGDKIKFTSDRINKYSNYMNKYYIITSVEFNYNGVPKLNIKCKEV